MMQGRRLGPANLTWLMDCAASAPAESDLKAFAEYGNFIGPDKVRQLSCCACKND